LKINTHFKYLSSIWLIIEAITTRLVFQWFPLHNLITVEPKLLRYVFDKQRLFCLMKQKQLWRYFVSSCTHLF